ncbi:hypothetical protein PanWU01x14_179410 [Parasponia andersonii]|uniref:Disease resistance N-terminal domain-containing protein n=1 Tax=Parasponia andersonii TaxID=3476 RepID=A0A2P5C6S2_PARAD|nr:hypothetical protein PanWU01x14_179410 [Parasponia andersonii]
MAEVVVSLVIERVTNMVVNEKNFLFGFHDQVQESKQRIRCFLIRDADTRATNGDKTFRNHVAELTDAAYDLEDVIAATYASEAATSMEANFISLIQS